MTPEQRLRVVREVGAAVAHGRELSAAEYERLRAMIDSLMLDHGLGVGASEVAKTASARLWALVANRGRTVEGARAQLRNWLLEDLTALERLLEAAA